MTITGVSTFGSRWRKTTRAPPPPSALAAETNSRVRKREHLRPDDARVRHPARDPEDQDDVPQARPQHRDDGQREQDERHGQHGVGHAHAQVVDPAPAVTGHQTDQRPQRPGHRHGGEADDERDTSPEDQPAQDVPPQVVRPEQGGPAVRGRPARRLQPELHLLRQRVDGGHPGGQDGRQGDGEEDRQPQQGCLVPDQLAQDPARLPPALALEGGAPDFDGDAVAHPLSAVPGSRLTVHGS